MATTTKAAAPAKKSGFQGVKAAWIILAICCAAGYGVWYFVMGNPDNFVGGDRSVILQTCWVLYIREVS